MIIGCLRWSHLLLEELEVVFVPNELVLLRGRMGSGKTEIGQYLRGALEDSVLMDLDLNANGHVESIDEVLGKKNIVAELFHGNSHTTDPQWIKAFQERDYNILSVILNTKLETCTNRVLVKRKDNRTTEEVKHYYGFFLQESQVCLQDESWNSKICSSSCLIEEDQTLLWRGTSQQLLLW